MVDDKVIFIESGKGPYQKLLHNVLWMVPDKDKNDVDLQRLLAFRLRSDGESATRDFLIHKIRDMIQCMYSGRLYDFLKNDQQSRFCPFSDSIFDPPETA